MKGPYTQEVLNKCLWRLQQPLWSEVGSLREGLRNQRETEKQRKGDREKETKREKLPTPGPGGSSVPLLPAEATLGPALLCPVFGSWGLLLKCCLSRPVTHWMDPCSGSLRLGLE